VTPHSAAGIRTDAGAFPFIMDLATGKTMDWTSGRVAEYLASSVAARVSVRGVRFIHRWFTLALDDHSDTHRCARSAYALCEVVSPWQYVFPTQHAAVVLGAPNACTETATNRELRLAGHNDISLCDVLSGHSNVVVTTDGRMQNRHSMLNDGLQTVLSLLAVFVVGCVVQHCAGGESRVVNSRWCAAACVAILVLVLATHDPKRLYVTHQVAKTAVSACAVLTPF
jgi:hypothetical protein